MRYSLTEPAAPPAEPITLAEAKLHLRIDSDITDQDALISALVQGAREWVENYCRRSLVERTLELRLDNWYREIRLPRGPVSAVASVKYVDSGGTLTTLAADQYQVDTYSVPARIVPAYGVIWPTVKTGEINAVLVTYTAGYTPGGASPTDYAENIPEAIKATIKLLVGNFYENRELLSERQLFEAPFAVKALLAPYEIRDFTLE